MPAAAALDSSRLSQLFAWLGHAYMHLLVALYLTIVLSLEGEWAMGYGPLIGLWTLGAFLVGLAAPVAGLLGDRWSNAGMMVAFFVGAGLAAIACGLADTPGQLTAALAALGLFAAIYHPVGMAWLVKTAANRGAALGIWGGFGAAGAALAGVTAGGLIDLADWRAAFWVPGAVSVATGLALLGLMLAGRIVERTGDRVPQADASRQDIVRAFVVMSLTVFLGGLIYQATQVAMPKSLTERLPGLLQGGAVGVGALFTLIYLIGGAWQVCAGWLTDRFALRRVYLIAYLAQAPLLGAAAALAGLPFFAAALLMVAANVGAQPAENALMARYTPVRWRGSAFGAKFVLSLGVGPVAVQLVAWLHGRTGELTWLYVLLAASAIVAALAILLLPRERAETPKPLPVAAAAE